ncbi:MAG: hypothetical protein JW750_11015 [Anaerolineaceae bacterium]|nr:hypothetical protein [Anaerolineaceae bacterium]
MTRLLISTTIRHSAPDQPSGFLYTLDWEQKTVLRRSEVIEPPFRERDTNPRGGVRGSKGIAVRNDEITLSNSSYVFRYTPDWHLIQSFGHPSCGGIHDVVYQGDSLWLTSARNDLLMQFALDGTLLNYYDARRFASALSGAEWHPRVFLSCDQVESGAVDFRDPASHDPHFSDAAHVNSAALLPDGSLLVSLGLLLNSRFQRLLLAKKWLKEHHLWDGLLKLNRQARGLLGMNSNMHSDLVVQPARGRSAVARVTAAGIVQMVCLFSGPTVPSHSVRVLRDATAIYLDTTAGRLIHFDPAGRELLDQDLIGTHFLRGARELPDGTLALGDQNQVIHYDLRQKTIIARYPFSDNTDEAVFDINFLPDHYDLPPYTFNQTQDRIRE